jgi:hypothetical protein
VLIRAARGEKRAGTGLHASANIFSIERITSRQFMSLLADRAPMQMGPNLAVSARIDLAEPERLRLDPKHRSSRLKIVFTKMAFQNPLGDHVETGTEQSTIRCGGTHPCKQGMALLMIGYYNDAAHFDQHVGEFDDLVKRIALPPESLVPEKWRSRPVPPLPSAPAGGGDGTGASSPPPAVSGP